jgi:hypothetical protein
MRMACAQAFPSQLSSHHTVHVCRFPRGKGLTIRPPRWLTNNPTQQQQSEPLACSWAAWHVTSQHAIWPALPGDATAGMPAERTASISNPATPTAFSTSATRLLQANWSGQRCATPRYPVHDAAQAIADAPSQRTGHVFKGEPGQLCTETAPTTAADDVRLFACSALQRLTALASVIQPVKRFANGASGRLARQVQQLLLLLHLFACSAFQRLTAGP